MSEQKTLAKYITEHLISGGFPGIDLKEEEKTISCSYGDILSFSDGNYCFNFIYFVLQKREFGQRDKYKTIIFPENFDIKKFLYFKNNGNYKLAYESQFKKIINPLNKKIEVIQIVTEKDTKRFYRSKLIISEDIFALAMRDAKVVYEKKNSYASSIESYLSGIYANEYGQNIKQKTTHIQKGEFAFNIDRFNLKTKKSKADFDKYMDSNDLESLEILVQKMIENEIFSESFLTKLNDYFIKEKLSNIIELGKKIILLNKYDPSNQEVMDILLRLGIESVGQLETLWQRYFEKYLLYIIFSYKKIFSKIELKDIEDGKKYPDFIGVNHYNGLDIIEIKTHLTKILVWDRSHNNFYFSPEMSKAIVQTTNYIDSITRARFKNSSDKNKITNFLTDEENLYHPKGIIIISSEKYLSTKKNETERLKRDFTKLRNGLYNIQILTFDEILGMADLYIKNIVKDTIE